MLKDEDKKDKIKTTIVRKVIEACYDLPIYFVFHKKKTLKGYTYYGIYDQSECIGSASFDFLSGKLLSLGLKPTINGKFSIHGHIFGNENYGYRIVIYKYFANHYKKLMSDEYRKQR